jgi:iron complex outermembrane recepter protein
LRYATFQARLSDLDLSDRRINPNGTPGFGILNIRAGLPLTPNTTLRLNINNVFNTSYREHATSIDGPGFGVNIGIDAQF